MGLAEKIVYLARAMRVKSGIKVRQPLKRIIIPVSSHHVRETISQVESVILDEINVKSVMYVDDDSEFVNRALSLISNPSVQIRQGCQSCCRAHKSDDYEGNKVS